MGFEKSLTVTEFRNQKLESLNPICAMFEDNKQVELNLLLWDSAENTRREKSRFFKVISPSQRQSPWGALHKRCSWKVFLKFWVKGVLFLSEKRNFNPSSTTPNDCFCQADNWNLWTLGGVPPRITNFLFNLGKSCS